MRTSYSALSTYKTCPLKFKFQEIDRIRVPKNLEALFGGIIHRCLKYMFERLPLYPAIDEVINRFASLWQESSFAEPACRQGRASEDEKKAYYEDGISILKNFYRLNQPWNFNVVDLESRFEVIIPDLEKNENHILTGIIDRIDKPEDDTYEIFDYKTSRKMPSQDNLNQDLQMSLYHLGLIKRWPHLKSENIKLSLYFLKHGEKITTSRTEKDLENTKNLIVNTIREIKKRIENNNFPPYPSGLCGWCGYKPMCPMWKHEYVKNKEVKTQKDIEQAIKEYFELKGQNTKNNKRLAQLQGLVYEFMNQEGVERVFGENGYLTKTMQERFVYDMEKIKKFLEEIGKWNEVITKKQFIALKASKKKISDK